MATHLEGQIPGAVMRKAVTIAGGGGRVQQTIPIGHLVAIQYGAILAGATHAAQEARTRP